MSVTDNTPKERGPNGSATRMRTGTPGSWTKGQSGNPSGRPKGRKSNVIARTAKERAELYVDQAFKLLSKAVLDTESPMSARVSAANSILDRAYGKAPQDVNVRGSVEHHIIALLKAIDHQDVKPIEAGELEVLPSTGDQPEPGKDTPSTPRDS